MTCDLMLKCLSLLTFYNIPCVTEHRTIKYMKKIRLLTAIVFSILSFSLTTFAASPTDANIVGHVGLSIHI